MQKALVATMSLCVVGCAHLKPPAAKTFTLASYKAQYRSPAPKLSVCGADPKLLLTELEGMNTLLSGFLQQTSAPPDGVWSDEQVALLDEAAKSMGPVLEGYQAELSEAKGCKIDPKLDFADVEKPADELTRQAKSRVQDAPTLLAQIKAHKALVAWHEGLPAQADSGKGQWCPPKPRAGQPDIFFAFQDEKGHSEWLFCDGSKVQVEGSGQPEFVPPPTDKKKHKPKPYLELAGKYPSSEISKAPAGPAPAEKPKTAEDDKVDINNPPPEP